MGGELERPDFGHEAGGDRRLGDRRRLLAHQAGLVLGLDVVAQELDHHRAAYRQDQLDIEARVATRGVSCSSRVRIMYIM